VVLDIAAPRTRVIPWRLRNNGDMAISSHTRKILWGFSGNACARCGTQLVMTPTAIDDQHAIVGRECHIVAQAPSGPRGMSGSRQDLDGYDNLILLCANCHAVVDGQSGQFPPEKLRGLKEAHEQQVRGRGAMPSMPDISWRGRDQSFQFEPALSGDTLLRRLASSESWTHDYPDHMSASRKETVGSFLQACQDWSEAYEDIGPQGQVEGGQDLQERIETLLMDEDLAIFVGTRQLALVGNGNELPWHETAIKIVDVQGTSIKDLAVNSVVGQASAATTDRRQG
jgi:hypothetical protein